MELGETFLETVEREVFEETNLSLIEPKLFGIYSEKVDTESTPMETKFLAYRLFLKLINILEYLNKRVMKVRSINSLIRIIYRL